MCDHTCTNTEYTYTIYYERSEFLIVGGGKNSTQKIVRKKKYAKKRAPILPASDSELRPRRSSGFRLAYTDLQASDSEHRPHRGGVRLAYRDPSGER